MVLTTVAEPRTWACAAALMPGWKSTMTVCGSMDSEDADGLAPSAATAQAATARRQMRCMWSCPLSGWKRRATLPRSRRAALCPAGAPLNHPAQAGEVRVGDDARSQQEQGRDADGQRAQDKAVDAVGRQQEVTADRHDRHDGD